MRAVRLREVNRRKSMQTQNLNNTKAPVVTAPQAVDGKREYEQLMDELCTMANRVRVIVGSLQDPLLELMRLNNENQRGITLKSTAVQVIAAMAGGLTGNGLKTAEIAGAAFQAWSYDCQSEKEHLDHLKTHWGNFANAVSQMSMNLETKRQQHDQKEAQRNAMQ